MFEDETGPMLELKWGPVKGKFSHDKHLNRLSGISARRLVQSVKQKAMPDAWKAALEQGTDPDHEAIAFSWKGRTVTGTGVILYSPRSRNATMIQRYRNVRQKIDPVFLRILDSFADHSADGNLFWAMYDIRAWVPETFALTRHRFSPGLYALMFSDKKRSFTLYRWGPASVLLGEENMATFAEQHLNLPGQAFHPVRVNDSTGLEWQQSRRRWFGIGKESVITLGRIWHAEQTNRLLGVQIEGKRKSDLATLMEYLCDHYETR